MTEPTNELTEPKPESARRPRARRPKADSAARKPAAIQAAGVEAAPSPSSERPAAGRSTRARSRRPTADVAATTSMPGPIAVRAPSEAVPFTERGPLAGLDDVARLLGPGGNGRRLAAGVAVGVVVGGAIAVVRALRRR